MCMLRAFLFDSIWLCWHAMLPWSRQVLRGALFDFLYISKVRKLHTFKWTQNLLGHSRLDILIPQWVQLPWTRVRHECTCYPIRVTNEWLMIHSRLYILILKICSHDLNSNMEFPTTWTQSKYIWIGKRFDATGWRKINFRLYIFASLSLKVSYIPHHCETMIHMDHFWMFLHLQLM